MHDSPLIIILYIDPIFLLHLINNLFMLIKIPFHTIQTLLLQKNSNLLNKFSNCHVISKQKYYNWNFIYKILLITTDGSCKLYNNELRMAFGIVYHETETSPLTTISGRYLNLPSPSTAELAAIVIVLLPVPNNSKIIIFTNSIRVIKSIERFKIFQLKDKKKNKFSSTYAHNSSWESKTRIKEISCSPTKYYHKLANQIANSSIKQTDFVSLKPKTTTFPNIFLSVPSISNKIIPDIHPKQLIDKYLCFLIPNALIYHLKTKLKLNNLQIKQFIFKYFSNLTNFLQNIWTECNKIIALYERSLNISNNDKIWLRSQTSILEAAANELKLEVNKKLQFFSNNLLSSIFYSSSNFFPFFLHLILFWTLMGL